MSFADEIKKAEKEINFALTISLRKIAKTSLGAIIDKTKVGNPAEWKSPAPPDYRPGKLKANWFGSLGTQKATRDDTIRDISGRKTKRKLNKVISRLQMNMPLFLTNSQPYAAEVENGGPRNRPTGMVKRVKAGFKQLIARALGG